MGSPIRRIRRGTEGGVGNGTGDWGLSRGGVEGEEADGVGRGW